MSAISIDNALLKVTSFLLGLVVLAFTTWAGVVWNIGVKLTEAQTVLLQTTTNNSNRIVYHEERIRKLEEAQIVLTNVVTELRTANARNEQVLVEVRDYLRRDQDRRDRSNP